MAGKLHDDRPVHPRLDHVCVEGVPQIMEAVRPNLGFLAGFLKQPEGVLLLERHARRVSPRLILRNDKPIKPAVFAGNK